MLEGLCFNSSQALVQSHTQSQSLLFLSKQKMKHKVNNESSIFFVMMSYMLQTHYIPVMLVFDCIFGSNISGSTNKLINLR